MCGETRKGKLEDMSLGLDMIGGQSVELPKEQGKVVWQRAKPKSGHEKR